MLRASFSLKGCRMKIDFLPLRDNTCGEYCLYCHAETVEWIVVAGRKR
jgi:hypothetical protein